MKLRELCRCALLVGASLSLTSCGGNLPGTAEVAGIVEYDGEPLTRFQHGAVSFTPTGGRRATGTINPADGSFRLSTFAKGDGVIVGPAKVTVSATVDRANAGSKDKYPGVRFVIPENFADRDLSGLSCEVVAGEKNFFRIKISSNGTGSIEQE